MYTRANCTVSPVKTSHQLTERNMIPQSHEGLGQYLGTIGKFPEVHDYDSATREEMITGHLKFVVSIAKRYARNAEDLLDLIQEGNIGLMNAVEKREKGREFAHYASLHIRSQIRNYLRGKDLMKPYTREGEVKETPCNIEEVDPSVNVQESAHERDVDRLMRSKSLTKLQQETLQLRMMGMSLQQIAQTRGVTHQAVSDLERSAIKTLKSSCATA